MIISLIAAMTPHRVIGKDNQLPWKMPADLAHFKHLTLNKPVIMGRKTYESIGQVLPDRHNIIITRNTDLKIPKAEIFTDLTLAFQTLSKQNIPEIFVIGGEAIYTLALPHAHKLYLTFIDATITGDAFFPDFNPDDFNELSRETHCADDNNPYDYCFIEFLKK